MRKLGSDIEKLVVRLSPDGDKARINMRARQVRERYKSVLNSVYKAQATLFLEHTNNVYILKKNDVKTLIVYVDDSIFAAELNAQRELIKLKLLELFGEDVEEFVINVSRGAYKKNYPYRMEHDENKTSHVQTVPLDENEIEHVSNTVSSIEDKKVRESLEKAMKADLEWKKGQKRKI